MTLRFRALICCLTLFPVGMAASYVRAANNVVYGEAQSGTQKGLGGLGAVVSWSNPNSVLYTCTNPNGFVLTNVVARSPVGTQPLSFLLTIGAATTSLTTANVTVLNTFTVPTAPVIVGTMGQSVVVTPVNTTTGSLSFDLLGYEIQ